MVAAVRVHKHGGPEVLTFEDIEVPAPGQGQIRIKQHACGVNFIDTYFRMGAYPSPVGMPFVAGNEGAGEVVAVGPGVTDIKVGDRVTCRAARRLCGRRVLTRGEAADSISYEQAAGALLQRVSLNRTFKVGQGTVALIHAAAGGVGLIACQWANHLGATVIGTVGSKGEGGARQGERRAPHHPLPRRFRRALRSPAAACATSSMTASARTRSGLARLPATTRHLRQLAAPPGRSAPSISTSADQGLAVRDAADAQPLHGEARRPGRHRDLFKVVGSSAVKIPVNQTYALKDAQKAHRDLEGRGTTGSSGSVRVDASGTRAICGRRRGSARRS